MKCNCNASQWYIVVALAYLICCRGCASRCDDMLQIAVALICTWQTHRHLWYKHDHCGRRCRLNRVASPLGDTFSLCTSFMLRYIYYWVFDLNILQAAECTVASCAQRNTADDKRQTLSSVCSLIMIKSLFLFICCRRYVKSACDWGSNAILALFSSALSVLWKTNSISERGRYLPPGLLPSVLKIFLRACIKDTSVILLMKLQ